MKFEKPTVHMNFVRYASPPWAPLSNVIAGTDFSWFGFNFLSNKVDSLEVLQTATCSVSSL